MKRLSRSRGKLAHVLVVAADHIARGRFQIGHLKDTADLLKQIARLKQERVLGGLPTYRPLVTFAWRDNKIDYVPWPIRDYWRSFQEVSWKQH